MNYQRIYNQLIERASKRTLIGYKENHHIIPKCLGGSNDNNLVALTAREHYIAHWLLVRIYPNNSKIANAFWRMTNSRSSKNSKVKITSRAYEEARIQNATLSRERQLNKTLTEDHIQKLKLAHQNMSAETKAQRNKKSTDKYLLWYNNPDKTSINEWRLKIATTQSKNLIKVYLNDNFYEKYPSVKWASRVLNISVHFIKKSLENNQAFNGYSFEIIPNEY